LKLVISNYPDGKVEQLDAVNNPEDPAAGTRKVPFSCELWIERDDFRDVAPKKYFRLTPGAEVRLRYAYIVKCTDFTLGPDGQVAEVRCTYDPATVGGNSGGRARQGPTPRGSAAPAAEARVRRAATLFSHPQPAARRHFL